MALRRFDFFTYEELDRLVEAAREEAEWQAAILVADDAGLRLGEILALQWEDVDFKTGTLTVLRTDWRRHVGSPKGVRAEDSAYAACAGALRAIRHLRVKLIFCLAGWEALDVRDDARGDQEAGEAGRAQAHGLARPPSHFCSQLAMKGAPPR